MDDNERLNPDSSTDFPALPHRQSPPSLINSALPSVNLRKKDQNLKRSLIDDTKADTQELITINDGENNNSDLGTKRKVIKLSYREPNNNLSSIASLPSLPSIDLDFLGGASNQNSDSRENSNEGLGSLGFNFNNARLDSLPDFDESNKYPPSVQLHSKKSNQSDVAASSSQGLPHVHLDMSAPPQSSGHNFKVPDKVSFSQNTNTCKPSDVLKKDVSDNTRSVEEEMHLQQLKDCQFHLTKDLKVRNNNSYLV